MKTLSKLALLSVGLFLSTACGDEADDGLDGGTSECTGAKCDTPQGEADKQCLDRQSEVLSSSNAAFTQNAIRWACADVEGVNAVGKDDRGQEYCEYFALFQPPPLEEGGAERPAAVDLGRPLNSSGSVSDLTVCVDQDGDGKDDDGRSDECRVLLNEDQFIYLEENPTDIVGQCVFTSWHADVEQPVPNCRAEDGSEQCKPEAQVLGFPFTKANFRMKISFNSNRAAADLVERCHQPGVKQDQEPEDWTNKEDPLTEPFYRGCMEVQEHFGTGWRRSDPSVCAVANRLRECNCLAPGVTNSKELGDAVVPPQNGLEELTLRGFKLGTWTGESELPPGCRYADTGEDLQALVLCDLTANDVFNALNDPKEVCRATYGNQVVVHVPIPAEAITCNPGDGPEAEGCGAMPWVIGSEGEAGEKPEPAPADPDPTPEPPVTSSNCCNADLGRKGCDDDTVRECVCKGDSWCCENSWDSTCVGEVVSMSCGQCE